jgi:hypothetical protein
MRIARANRPRHPVAPGGQSAPQIDQQPIVARLLNLGGQSRACRIRENDPVARRLDVGAENELDSAWADEKRCLVLGCRRHQLGMGQRRYGGHEQKGYSPGRQTGASHEALSHQPTVMVDFIPAS